MENHTLDNELIEQPHENVEYAGFWIRVGATLIDGLVLIPVIGLNMANLIYIKSLPLQFLVFLISFFYKPLMEGKYGATLGKMALNLKVVQNDLKPIGMGDAFMRYIPWIITSAISLISSVILFNDPSFVYIDRLLDYSSMPTNPLIQTLSTLASLFLLASCITVAFADRKRGIHDLMASTLVIQKDKSA